MGSDTFKHLSKYYTISIHASCMGSDCIINPLISYTFGISILAPCVGSDIIMQMVAEGYPISIHAPRMGCDIRFFHVVRCSIDFILINSTMISLYFNSCSLCGERCCISKVVHGLFAISILAPCLRSDSARWSPRCSPRYFNSRFRVGSDVCSWQDCFA